jgi:hypothetical protein
MDGRGLRCTQCGCVGLEPGYVEDAGQHSRGYSRWIGGPLERGVFGGARRFGKQRWQIEAFRRPECAHLELFAATPV